MLSALLGIDWGTSNRRAYVIRRDGRCVQQHADGQGLLAVNGEFAASLAALRASMGVDPDMPVVMSGMVGSASGWQEVPYLDASVPLALLPDHLVPVANHPRCFIVPGYSSREPVDVMRGEETQLLGACALGLRDGWMVLPGTHSKWVFLRDCCIEQMSTYMTGELFAQLKANGTLSSLMGSGVDDPAAFAAGLAEARLGKPLTHSLFGVRARVVTKAMPAHQAASFVSGLLIGGEFLAAQPTQSSKRQSPQSDMIHLIASKALSVPYADAAAYFGIEARVLDPDQVYLAALQQFFTKV